MASGIVLATLFISTSGCNPKIEEEYDFDTDVEMIQMFADSFASIDESGGKTSGNITGISHPTGDEKFYARIHKTDTFTARLMNDLFIPKSYATACAATLFNSCSGGKKVRAFAGCTVPGPTINNVATQGTLVGSIELTFTGTEVASCEIPVNGDAVARVPNYTLTGLRKATFKVSTPSTGQLVTRIGGSSFTYDNAGIRRTVTNSEDDVVFDMTTSTTSSMVITGQIRDGRTLASGGILVADAVNGRSCTFTISSPVSWTAACNCPTAGEWTATCTDSTNINVIFGTTCGEVTYTTGSGFKSTILDRCQQ